jgi:hypothetical protein
VPIAGNAAVTCNQWMLRDFEGYREGPALVCQ